MEEKTGVAARGDADRGRAHRPAPRRGLVAPVTRPGVVLAIVVTAQLMIVLDNTVVNLALPSIQHDLGFATTSLAWVTTAYVLTFGGLLLLGGRLGDVLGRRPVFAAGIGLFTLSSLVGGAAPEQAVLLAARAVQGIGAALAAPSALAILLATFAEGQARNKALGLFFAMSAAGGAIGLLLGGALTSLLSWRWVFWINVPLGAAVVVLTLVFVGQTARRSRRIDLPGSLLSTAAVGSLVYAFVRAGSAGWTDTATLTAFGAAAGLLGVFVTTEANTAQPLLPLRLLTDRTSASAYATMLLVPAVMVGLYFFTSQFLQVVSGYSAIRTGTAFLPMSALIFAMSRIVPPLLGRYGPRRFMITGGVALTLAVTWLTQLSADSSYWGGVAPALVLVGFGGGLLYMPVSSVLMAGVHPEDTGAASGALQTMQQVGAALGVAVLVSVFGNVQRGAPGTGPAGYADAVGTAFEVGAVLALAALVLIVAGVRVRPTPPALVEDALADVPEPATTG